MKIYKSKVDWWLGLPLIYLIFRSIQSIFDGEMFGYLALIGIIFVILFLSKTTRYIISEDKLIVKSTWIVNDNIEIDSIRKIEKSNTILSAPALSLDRLVVKYNKFDEIYISPKDKLLFVNELIKINPNIEVKI